MGVLEQVFNMVTRLHSRAATLKRIGTPTTYSPCRITPSNYSRLFSGPSQVVITGREFLIPVASLKGTATELISFDVVPSLGTYTLTYGTSTTAAISFDAAASDVQVALRLITALADVVVSGNYASGFLVKTYGVETPTLLTATGDVDFDAAITIAFSAPEKWANDIKRGDKIIDPLFGHLSIKDITEISDLGTGTMGYRCQVD